MRPSRKRRLSSLLVVLALCPAALVASCMRYRYDVPTRVMQAPDAQVWGVALLQSEHGYRVASVTKLNGTALAQTQRTKIASGEFQNWQWTVDADHSLLPSWRAWQNDKKVQTRAMPPDNWNHPAADWEQTFNRAYKVANYLLGRQPLALRATLLLIPNGSAYDKITTAESNEAVPITLGFYYPQSPSSSDDLTGERFSALAEAVSRTLYEYQHLLIATKTSESVGRGEADKAVNDEAISQCWFDSTLVALTSGTHSVVKWDDSSERLALLERDSEHKISPETETPLRKLATTDSVPDIKFSDAVLWARFREGESVTEYFRSRNLAPTVSSREPAQMNALLSVCRAMTQHPVDLTTGAYPASRIQYVPFFPVPLDSKKTSD